MGSKGTQVQCPNCDLITKTLSSGSPLYYALAHFVYVNCVYVCMYIHCLYVYMCTQSVWEIGYAKVLAVILEYKI